jgi:hypothetical protein
VSSDRSARDHFWYDLPDSGGRIPEHLGRTETHGVGRSGAPAPLEEASPFAEIGHAEGGMHHDEDHEGIRQRQAGPLGRQGHEPLLVIDAAGAVLVPVVPVGQEGEFPPVQGMKGMGHTGNVGTNRPDRVHPAAQTNGVAERFIRTLEGSWLGVHHFATVAELMEALQEVPRRYNEPWLIARQGYQSPARVRRDPITPIPVVA